MASELTLHEVYMNLTFRPLLTPSGELKMVGVQLLSVACVEPECYPNLLMAAPAMYQMLNMLLPLVDQNKGTSTIDAIQQVLTFAQNGYLGGPNIDDIIAGIKK